MATLVNRSHSSLGYPSAESVLPFINRNNPSQFADLGPEQQLLLEQFCEAADLAAWFPLIHPKNEIDQYIDLLIYSRFLGHKPTFTQKMAILAYRLTGSVHERLLTTAATDALAHINRVMPQGYFVHRTLTSYCLVKQDE